MPTDIIYYLAILLATLGFGLLVYVDRLFGVLGMFTGFLGGVYIANTGQIFTAQVYNTTTAAWIFSVIPFTEFGELMILLGIVTTIDAVILIMRLRSYT